METDAEISNEAAKFYQASLTPEVKSYLISRGFSEETIQKYMIGFACGGLREHLCKDCGFSIEDCISAGLLSKTEKGIVHDFFYKRIIFPVIAEGEVKLFTGRALGDGQPKYLHLRGEIKFLFNEDDLNQNEVIIAEGIIDSLTLLQNGFPSVAVLGSGAFKTDFVSKFGQVKKIFSVGDGDDAGRAMNRRIAELFGDRARIIVMPDGMDVNEFFKMFGKEKFEELKKTAVDIVGYELSFIPADAQKSELPLLLEPILQILGRMDELAAEAILNEVIKNRFSLSAREVQGYRKRIRENRRHATEEDQDVEEEETIPVARFPNLVDIVDDHGLPAFLVKEGNTIRVVQFIPHGPRDFCSSRNRSDKMATTASDRSASGTMRSMNKNLPWKLTKNSAAI